MASHLFKTLQKSALALLLAASCSGCSIFLALDGEEEPDVCAAKQQIYRGDIDAILGDPISVEPTCDGHLMATYEYIEGKDGSIIRASLYALLDLATLGLWEIAGMRIERNIGDKIHFIAIYDTEGRLISAKEKVVD